MKPSIIWIAVLAGALAADALAGGNQYEVNIAGEVGSTAFKTVAGGLVKLKDPGDVLTIQHGIYPGSVELHGVKGTAKAPIIIHGVREPVSAEEAQLPPEPNAGLKHAPVIKADKDYALMLKDCSYVQIDGLAFTAAKSHGVYLESCDHITIRDCEVLDNVRTQIMAKLGDHITIDGCELSGSSLEHGCQFLASNQPAVRNCLIHHNAAAGISISADKAVGGDGLIDSPVIESNVLYANGKLKDGAAPPKDDKGRDLRPAALRDGAAAICGDGVEKAIIRNNLIYRNQAGGIVLYRQTAARAGMHDRVLHNTIYLADCGEAFGLHLATSTQDTSVYNNIIVTDKGPAIWLGPNASRELHSDGNVLFRLDNTDPLKREAEDLPLVRWQELYRIDRGSLVLQPPFVDPDNADLAKCDYQLKPDSPLGGKCQFTGEAPTDCLGKWRPRDKVTPGCYELNGTAGNPNERPADPAHRQPKPDGGPAPTPAPPTPAPTTPAPPGPPKPPTNVSPPL